MTLTLDLPDDIAHRLLTDREHAESDLHRELAIALYAAGKLPPGRAAQLAGMDRWEFEKLLVEREVPFPMDEAEILAEVENALRRR